MGQGGGPGEALTGEYPLEGIVPDASATVAAPFPEMPPGAECGMDAAVGLLGPMTRQSWLSRPFSAGFFLGFMDGGELVDDWVTQEEGFFGGFRMGWDIDHHWGLETRFGFASLGLEDSDRARAAQEAGGDHFFEGGRDSDVFLWDVEALWYPFGETYLRPYVLAGLGVARVDFTDRFADARSDRRSRCRSGWG